MEQASTDFALVTGRHLAVQSRLDNLETQMAAFILQLNRVERFINQSQAAAAEAQQNQTAPQEQNEAVAKNETEAQNQTLPAIKNETEANFTGLGQQAEANQTEGGASAAVVQQPDMDKLKQQVMNDLLEQIQNQGLKIGNNWMILQKGDNLWVQNFMNQTNQTAPAANENQPSGGAAAANETQPEANQTQPVGPEINANQTQPIVNIINETILNQTTLQAESSAKFLVGDQGQES